MRRFARLARAPFIVIITIYLLAFVYRVYARKYYVWLPNYTLQSFQPAPEIHKPVHIIFLHSDHFEPAQHNDWLRQWEEQFPRLASRHRDSTGRRLRHTMFYPGEQAVPSQMEALLRIAASDCAEVELQLHHDHDTAEDLRRKLRRIIGYFQQFGFLKTVDGETRFGFVHGNYGLDNSMGPEFCGVNRELELLRELGCFADFTFVSLWKEAQPSLVNTIYAATDDDRPKSYDRGVRLRAGRRVEGDLVIFPGPLIIHFTPYLPKLFFAVEDGDIHPAVPTTEQRVDLWVRANIHVQGRPDWVFVKVHGHGISSVGDIDEHLGDNFDRALSYLERRYNDGVNYILHYVTAREAYNLALAATANQQGDPSQYLDWVIKPYVAGEADLRDRPKVLVSRYSRQRRSP